MKINSISLYGLLISLLSLSSCEIVKGIFKAGVWTGILLVVGVIALIIYLASKKSSK